MRIKERNIKTSDLALGMIHHSEEQRDLNILEKIEQDPETTQASLASQLGVAVGTINWHLKRLVDKGYVKVRRAQRRRLRYLITPEGIALRARLTIDYINTSFQLYRLVRQRMIAVLRRLRANGIKKVSVDGEGDVAEVCRLTCLDQGFEVYPDKKQSFDETIIPLKIVGLKIFVVGVDVPDHDDFQEKEIS